MGKKKPCLSLFSTFVQQINEHDSKISSNDCHLIDNEYFAAFNTLDDIQQFHSKITKKQQEQPNNIDDDANPPTEDDPSDMDMKSFAQQYLIDLPEHMTKVTENQTVASTPSKDLFNARESINWSPKVKVNKSVTQSPDSKKRKATTPVKRNMETANKRIRRNMQDLPESNQFVYMSDNDNQNDLNSSDNIFQCLQNEISSNEISVENMNSILSTLNKRKTVNESIISIELAEPSMIKNEPVESGELVVETKEEPIELNMVSEASMGFGTSHYSGDLDHYVQNIHLLHQSSNPEPFDSSISSRPKRIRKRKKLYIEESETITRPKKVKIPIRKKRSAPPLPQVPSTLLLTDAEIEQQFGERLPTVKSEQDDDTQQIVNSQIVIEYEPVSNPNLTPLEQARAKLLTALGRGHGPDTYSLKIRSREHQIIEVQLAIYSTADWHPHRIKVLAKVEEALRGLRVSWTKIDIHVDNFDIEISTSSQLSKVSPPTNTNSSWFLKALSESGPVIVHIHDRRHPQQRFLIKCSCSECSPISVQDSIDSSLPVIVNVSPAKTPPRRLMTPAILNKTPQKNVSLLHNIDTSFFNELIHQWGRTTIVSVTQCVLDLSLIVSVHASIPSLCVSPNYSKEEYKKKYQQIIDPLQCTLNEKENNLLSKSATIPRIVSVNPMNNKQSIVFSKSPDILNFYNSIKRNKTNIRNAKEMRDLITKSFSTTVTSPPSPSITIQSNVTKGRTLILPKPTSSLSNNPTTMTLVEFKRIHEQNRRPSQIHRHDKNIRTYSDSNETKQQANCTSFIELKPILGGSSSVTKQNNELKKVITINGLNETQHANREMTSPSTKNARVIRLSIAKSGSSIFDQQTDSTSPSTIRLLASPKSDSDTSPSHSNAISDKGDPVPLVPKKINIIKPLSSSSPSITPAIKLSNPILISHKSQQSSIK
ncbi:unnamed protein product [Rotaria magnacalcarata]|uniref:Uncharacterized protein n=8 Tax=Rotaria magnacalcarata TaxID=392030 RepID=A0A819RNB1_9BILA|nr:unnamed protein product [Rotaria magnacalcarata]CAF2266232.1 unnamed protein product [Rotaria magnacalcarata]CAF3828542.1 unnamed protein product [Rotaria magnacalcarata]CAF4050651.1 unnamed protein product [Rotaria magnacalcarata]